MTDFRTQLLAHEQILSKYKKLLLEQPNEKAINQNKKFEESIMQGLNGGSSSEQSVYRPNNYEQNVVPINRDKLFEKPVDQRNLSDIESIKAKYLNKTNSSGINIPISSSLRGQIDSNPIFSKYQSGMNLLPNKNQTLNVGVAENSNNRMNEIEAIKLKYLRNNLNDNRVVRNDMDMSKITQKRSSSESNVSSNFGLKPVSEPDKVLEEFKKKYSEQNIEKILEERLKMLQTSPQISKVSPLIKKEDEPNVSTQQNLETSSLEVIKLLNGQSNIKYNISNQSNVKAEGSRKEIYHDDSLQVDNISNSLIHSSEMSSQRITDKEDSLQIESINEIITGSNKIIENYEKNKADLFGNLSTIVENVTEKVIENDKKQTQIKEKLKKIDNDVIPISERLAQLKNLKTSLTSEINKTKLKGSDSPQQQITKQVPKEEENLLRFSQSKVELLKIPKSRKKKIENKESNSSKENSLHCVNQNLQQYNKILLSSQVFEIMNSLVFETTRQVFDEKVPLKEYSFQEVKVEDETTLRNVESPKNEDRTNKKNSDSLNTGLTKSSKAPIISTRGKALPKRNLCSFDNFINSTCKDEI